MRLCECVEDVTTRHHVSSSERSETFQTTGRKTNYNQTNTMHSSPLGRIICCIMCFKNSNLPTYYIVLTKDEMNNEK